MKSLKSLTAFLIYVLGFVIISFPAYSQTNPSLSTAYKNRFNIAVALDGRLPYDYSPKELNLIRTQFNVLTPANCMKMYHIQRRQNIFDFEHADAFVAFAAANNQKVLGHCLIWAKDVRTPAWFFKNGDNPPTRELLLK
jgi:GH35 family endo-1,4-beta-xylanase